VGEALDLNLNQLRIFTFAANIDISEAAEALLNAANSDYADKATETDFG
jgi:hypothetical protein